MKKKGRMARARPISGGGAVFWVLMAGMSLVAGGLALFWYVSPLAFGFADWSGDDGTRSILSRLYRWSWSPGIALFLGVQGLALALAGSGRRMAAGIVAASANLGFALLVGAIMGMAG